MGIRVGKAREGTPREKSFKGDPKSVPTIVTFATMAGADYYEFFPIYKGEYVTQIYVKAEKVNSSDADPGETFTIGVGDDTFGEVDAFAANQADAGITWVEASRGYKVQSPQLYIHTGNEPVLLALKASADVAEDTKWTFIVDIGRTDG